MTRSYQRRTSRKTHAALAKSSQPLYPAGNSDLPRIIISKRTTHPNIFRKRIQKIEGDPSVGDWVSVYFTNEDTGLLELFAYGLYNPKSEIAVRLIRWSQDLPDEEFWDSILDRAVSLRQDAMKLDSVTDSYRVLHAEADGTPGIVIDRYGETLSAEVFSYAMASRCKYLIDRLSQRLGTRHWLMQPSPHLESQEGFRFASQASPNLPRSVTIQEHGVKYQVNFGEGHKTGFFCDQRDNRKRLTEFCRGKSVLDICCYTGGFAVMAAAAGADSVTGVDLDSAPLELAKRNAAINSVRAKFTQADAFAYMRDMLRNGNQFDVVVLDPPKLIRNRSEIDEGTRKHFDLNRLAMQLVKPGGMMLTCSCAGLLQASEFTRLVRSAARSAFLPTDFNPNATPRLMQIIAQSGAAVCHPVSANCPETEYLKAIWLRL